MKLYVYEIDTNLHVATINGKDNADCEAKMTREGYEDDVYASTYCEPTINGDCGQIKAYKHTEIS